MSDAELLQLARAAGVRPHWQDYRGQPHEVPADTLRQVLAALGLPADDEATARASLAQLHEQQAQQRPQLLVGRADRQLPLPPALARCPDAQLELRFENGETHWLTLERDGDASRLPAIGRPGYHRLRCAGSEIALAIAPAGHGPRLRTPRCWGAAVPLYGLRRGRRVVDGEHGLGDYGALADCARAFGRRGAEALAISPVHALFSADPAHYSPYSPSSRLFLNVFHVHPSAIAPDDWLAGRIAAHGFGPALEHLASAALIDWPAAARIRLTLLHDAWQAFDRLDSDGSRRRDFDQFRRAGGALLEDHARFEALHAAQFAADPARWHWQHWPAPLRDPRSRAVAEFADAHADAVGFHAFLQWLADRGLQSAQAAARSSGMDIGLICDLAVGTDAGGSHCWSRQDDMLAGLSIGAPPDELNSRGQNWGLTTFSPRALQAHGYAPFIELLRAGLRHAGGLRIDHILGLNRLWLVPDGAGPRDGAYVDYPLHDLIHLIALEADRHGATIVGEDLGTVPAGFRDELAEGGLLGMRVLYFERDHGYFVEPARWSSRAVAMTTTHDLPTVAGWWQGRDLDWLQRLDLLPPGHTLADEQLRREQDRVALWNAFVHAGSALGTAPAADAAAPVVDAALDFVAQTPAPLALIPIEDLLGNEEQPNLPGTTDQHPNWRRRLADDSETLLAREDVTLRLERLQQARAGLRS